MRRKKPATDTPQGLLDNAVDHWARQRVTQCLETAEMALEMMSVLPEGAHDACRTSFWRAVTAATYVSRGLASPFPNTEAE